MDGPWERVTRRSVLGALAGAGVWGVLGPGTAAAAGGDRVWEFQTGASVYSSPTVADGTVFVGSDDNSVYALDAGDGSQLWEFWTGWSVYSSPTGPSSSGVGMTACMRWIRVFRCPARARGRCWGRRAITATGSMPARISTSYPRVAVIRPVTTEQHYFWGLTAPIEPVRKILPDDGIVL